MLISILCFKNLVCMNTGGTPCISIANRRGMPGNPIIAHRRNASYRTLIPITLIRCMLALI